MTDIQGILCPFLIVIPAPFNFTLASIPIQIRGASPGSEFKQLHCRLGAHTKCAVLLLDSHLEEQPESHQSPCRWQCDYLTHRKHLGKRAEESQHLPLSFHSRRSHLALLMTVQGARLRHTSTCLLDTASEPVQIYILHSSHNT